MSTPAMDDNHPLRILAAGRTGDVRWLDDGMLAVLDPALALRVNAANFADMTLRRRWSGWAPGRRQAAPVTWAAVRSAWLTRLRDPASPGAAKRLADRMASRFDAAAGTEVDLIDLAHQACTRALVPVVIDGLRPRDSERVTQYVALRAASLTDLQPQAGRRRKSALLVATQAQTVSIVWRALRARAAGHAASTNTGPADLLDPLSAGLLPGLGTYHAVDSVLAALTAIAGPPGAVLACLLYELARRPEWAERLAAELAPLDPGQLGELPTPVTQRFIKEVLRLWSPFALLVRDVRTPLMAAGATLTTRDRYAFSPYLLHRDARYWADPASFNPDRWQPGADAGPATGGCYMPFGWPPRTCVGAGLATVQLTVACHLACVSYRIEVAEPHAIRMGLRVGPVPMNFRGRIRPAT